VRRSCAWARVVAAGVFRGGPEDNHGDHAEESHGGCLIEGHQEEANCGDCVIGACPQENCGGYAIGGSAQENGGRAIGGSAGCGVGAG